MLNPDLFYLDEVYLPNSFKQILLNCIESDNISLFKDYLKKDVRLLWENLKDD
jgi:hypothetical protein